MRDLLKVGDKLIHVGAQYFLGLCYNSGNGVPQDYQESAKWFRKAAEQGSAQAQYNYAPSYYQGQGVLEDYIEAYKWVLLARKNGQDASKSKEIRKAEMTSSQIAQAPQWAKDFVAKQEGVAAASASPSAPSIQRNDAATVKGTGTGFFISGKGYLLTAYHVVEDTKRLEVHTAQGTFPAEVVVGDAANDIAVLRVKVQETISSLSGLSNDPRLFQISTPIQPGNSGGPIVNAQGEVVGVIVARLSEKAALQATGSLPENVNYAVKSSFVLPLLESLPDAADLLSAPKQNDTTTERSAIIEKVKAAVRKNNLFSLACRCPLPKI